MVKRQTETGTKGSILCDIDFYKIQGNSKNTSAHDQNSDFDLLMKMYCTQDKQRLNLFKQI